MKYAIYILTFFLLAGCSSSIKTYTVQEQNAYENLQNLVASKNFEIIAQRAMPMMSVALTQVLNSNLLPPGNTASQINIIGNSNSVKIKGDSITAFLPFYGEQFFGSNLGNNHHGITFNGVPENYKVILDEHNRKVDISFKIKDSYQTNEFYVVNITLFPSNSSTIYVQSTIRSNMQFTGEFKGLSKDVINR